MATRFGQFDQDGKDRCHHPSAGGVGLNLPPTTPKDARLKKQERRRCSNRGIGWALMGSKAKTTVDNGLGGKGAK
jgi:hypothetical protein